MPNNANRDPWSQLKAAFRSACSRRIAGDQNAAVLVLRDKVPGLVAAWAKSSNLDAADKKHRLKSLFEDESERAEELAAIFELFAGKFESTVANRVAEHVLQEVHPKLEEIVRDAIEEWRKEDNEAVQGKPGDDTVGGKLSQQYLSKSQSRKKWYSDIAKLPPLVLTEPETLEAPSKAGTQPPQKLAQEDGELLQASETTAAELPSDSAPEAVPESEPEELVAEEEAAPEQEPAAVPEQEVEPEPDEEPPQPEFEEAEGDDGETEEGKASVRGRISFDDIEGMIDNILEQSQ